METKVIVGGVGVDPRTSAEWALLLEEDWRSPIEKRIPKVFTTANGQVISLCELDPSYRDAVAAADYVAADGMSVVFGSRLFGDNNVPERVATTDWFHVAAATAERVGISFYLLGGSEETISRAVDVIRATYPALRIAGFRNGYFSEDQFETIAYDVNASGADVLWLAIGNPKQVLLAHRFKAAVPRLTWVRTCGGLFDFIAGKNSRAPKFMQGIGLEWLYRMLREPRRLARRYVTTNTRSLYLIATRTGKNRQR